MSNTATGPERNVIALALNKGGAGKTTFTLGVADALVRLGLSVLVVDMDPQGNASQGLGHAVEPVATSSPNSLGSKVQLVADRVTVEAVIENGSPGIAAEAVALVDWGYSDAEVFARGGPLSPGQIGALGVIPTWSALEGFGKTWQLQQMRLLRAGLRLSEGEEPAPSEQWDVVLIDCAPAGGNVTIQALMAADYALLVTQANAFAVKGVESTLAFVSEMRSGWDHRNLAILGVAVNEAQPKLADSQVNLRDLTEVLDDLAGGDGGAEGLLLSTSIPERSVVGKSQSAQQPISAFLASPSSNDRSAARVVTRCFEDLALTLLDRIGHSKAPALRDEWQRVTGAVGPDVLAGSLTPESPPPGPVDPEMVSASAVRIDGSH